MKLYWGDIHNHCGITYGFGGLENALEAARAQLDFCNVTGHAMWPDIPERTKEIEFIVDFHNEGFKKLRNNWEYARSTIEKANNPGEFVTFQGYEMHSSKYGDHHVCSPDGDLPLIYGENPADLIEKLKPYRAIVVPHHIGYTPGYRGINWDYFSQDISPVVEVFSKHGCAMSEKSMYPYLHTMGPRDSRNLVYEGIKRGNMFGFVASTDHHAGYPGSFGDGRMAVWASEKTRESIWEAILARRTYAVTGDRIACYFSINGAAMGSKTEDKGKRSLHLDVTACDTVDKIVVYKNSKPWKIVNGEMFKEPSNPTGHFKIRVETGWGRSVEGYKWDMEASVNDGNIISAESCFRGRSVLAPTPEMREDKNINRISNNIIKKTESKIQWECTSFKNPSTLHPQTSAVVLEIEGDTSTALNLNVNGCRVSYTIDELIKGNRSMQMGKFNGEAVLVHGAVHEDIYKLSFDWEDKDKEREIDIYHVEVRQSNGQMAWITPVFVKS